MTLNISLVISGDASGAKNAAAETKQAISALMQESGNASATMQKAFADLKNMASGSIASIFEARTALGALAAGNSAGAINARLGIWNDSGADSRGKDIAAYGQQLDSLRAKFNPLFAAGQQYKQTLTEINMAAAVGAIGEKERVAALQQTKGAFAAAVGAIRDVSEATDQNGMSLRGQRGVLKSLAIDLALLSPQFGGVTGAVGSLYIANSRLFEGFGGFKNTISGLLTPINLLVGGMLAVAAGSLVAYQSIIQTEKKFGALSERTDTSVRSLHAFESAAALKGIVPDDFIKGMEQIGDLTDQAKNNLGSLAPLFRANGVAAGTLTENLLHGADFIRNARSEAEKYRLIQQLGLPATREWVRFLSQGSDELQKVAAGAVQFGSAADEQMIRKAREFDAAWDSGWQNFSASAKRAFIDARGGLEDLRRWANNLGQDLHPGMLGLRLNNSFDSVGDYSNRQLQSALELRAAQLRNGGSNTVDPEALNKQLALELQRIGVLGQLASIQDEVRRSEIGISQARLAGVNITATEEARIQSYAEATALGTLAIHKQADAARIEYGAIGLGVGATAAFRAEQERLADFRLRGIKLTEQQSAAIRDEAKALGEVTLATALGKLRSDITFESSQIGRSSDEQSIATRLRGLYGDNYQADLNGAIAGQMRLNQQLQFTHDLGGDALKSFNNDLIQNKKLGEAATNALVGGLNKVSAKMLDMAYNNLWSAIFPGGGSGLFGLIGLGGGGGGGGLPGVDGLNFAGGGWTGNMSQGAIAGVVHGGEFVFDADSTAAIGVPALEAIRRGARGYADGGYVGPPSLAAWNGGAASSGGFAAREFKLVVENHGPPVAYTAKQISHDEVRLIAQHEAAKAIDEQVPPLVAMHVANPSSPVSQSLSANTYLARKLG